MDGGCTGLPSLRLFSPIAPLDDVSGEERHHQVDRW
jgi:hypothetical protein